MNRKSTNVLFVGAFNKQTKDGSSGGQLFACTSLLESDLGRKINFIKIDTTSETVPAPPVYKRIPYVIARLAKFLYYILFKRIDSVLIFSSAKLSFIEKGLMAILAYLLSKRVIFAPRSGLSLKDYDNSKFMRFFMPFVVKHCTYILCQGESWKKFYKGISGERDEKFIIINNWIDIQPYLQEVKVINDSGTLKILYIGWFEEYKGIKDLLSALEILSANGVEFKCELYGSGSLSKFVEYWIIDKKMQTAIFNMGWADKNTKLAALRAADIYVLPSHYEGFPNALLEAMASALPVVATDIDSIKDIVEHGHNGLLSRKMDPKELAFKLTELIKNPELRSQIAYNARETVLKRFSLDVAVKKFEQIL